MMGFKSEQDKKKYFSRLSEDGKIDAFRDMLEVCTLIVFLGGAGVSTESGIPDFRSKNGLYHKQEKRFSGYRPEYLLSYDCLKHEPEVFFDYYRRHLDARNVEPNAAHYSLAEMEKAGKLDGVITQNIDGLHQKAGSINVREIHGTILKNHCVFCKEAYDKDFIFDNRELIPQCPKCGKMVRPDVTLYGELLPEEAYQASIRLLQWADLMIIGGTSLEVGSAAQLAHLYHGKYLVIINKTKTRMEGKADLVFHESIGKILTTARDAR